MKTLFDLCEATITLLGEQLHCDIWANTHLVRESALQACCELALQAEHPDATPSAQLLRLLSDEVEQELFGGGGRARAWHELRIADLEFDNARLSWLWGNAVALAAQAVQTKDRMMLELICSGALQVPPKEEVGAPP